MAAVLRLLSNLLRLALLPLWWIARRLRRPGGAWLQLQLDPTVVELAPETGRVARWFAGLRGPQPTSLGMVETLVDALVQDERVQGLLVIVPPLHASWATCEGLREQLQRVRAAGKQVVAYLPRGGSNHEMFVALAADRIFLSPPARVAMPGPLAEAYYFSPLLERLGVAVEVLAQGEYKTAAESATRDSMSEPQREQLGALLRAVQDALEHALSARTGMDPAARASVFERGPLSAAEALRLGLVDGLAYDDELPRLLDPAAARPAWPAGAGAYLRWQRGRRLWTPVRTEPYIAVVAVHGVIGERPSGPRADYQERLTAALRGAAKDRRVAAVVLHIDSPGGSALLSDLLHREVVQLARHKPVVACMGRVAASGGYYLAAAAQRIVCRPLAVTGSIGVILAKPEASRLLERAGIRAQVVKLTPHADMYSVARGLEPSERDMLERDAEDFYTTFLQVVASGRGLALEQVRALAGGRVWSGKDAHARGLVDALGGLPEALEQARSLLTDLDAASRRRLRGRPYRTTVQHGRVPPPLAAPDTSEVWELYALIQRGGSVLYLAPFWLRLG